jgi:hypothetical protein
MTEKADISFVLPPRQEGEPEITERQLGFIRSLLETVDAEGFPEEKLDTLGRWQASVLIDRLIELRDGVETEKTTIVRDKQQWKPSISLAVYLVLVMFGLFLLALLFARLGR